MQTLEKLPDEIILSIIGLFKISDTVNLAKTCKRLKRIAEIQQNKLLIESAKIEIEEKDLIVPNEFNKNVRENALFYKNKMIKIWLYDLFITRSENNKENLPFIFVGEFKNYNESSNKNKHYGDTFYKFQNCIEKHIHIDNLSLKCRILFHTFKLNRINSENLSMICEECFEGCRHSKHIVFEENLSLWINTRWDIVLHQKLGTKYFNITKNAKNKLVWMIL